MPFAREGTQVPFLPAGVTYGAPDWIRREAGINSSGQVVLEARLEGTANDTNDGCIVTGLPGALQLVAREGDAIPGGGGLLWGGYNSDNLSGTLAINEAGAILMRPLVAGPGVTSANDACLAAWTPTGGATVWACEGEQASGMAPGVKLDGEPELNFANWDRTGNTSFFWDVEDGGATIGSANSRAIWYGGPSGYSLILQSGTSTGLPGGETFEYFHAGGSTVDATGTPVFTFVTRLADSAGVSLPGGTSVALVTGRPGAWQFVLREGGLVPGLAPSVNGPWKWESASGAPRHLTSGGHTMFSQSVTDGVDTKSMVFTYHTGTGFQVVHDAQEVWATSVGTTTASPSYDFGSQEGNGSGGPMWLNDAGDFVIKQEMANSSIATVRGHIGKLHGSPANLSRAAGGTHSLSVNAGPTHGGMLYVIVGTDTGTNPGQVNAQFGPLGPLTLPLNPGPWFDLSIKLANTAYYTNTLGLCDANGKATASFNLPPGVVPSARLLHHAVIGLDLSVMQTFASEPAAVKLY